MTEEQPNRWDQRYDEERYFYGEEPNYLVARELPGLAAGRGLFLAEGEGRNIVFAAGLGHEVVGVDSSKVGARKTLDLAKRRGVEVEYRIEDLVASDWDRQAWDFVVLCFCHLPPEVRADVHARVAQCITPGGTLILNSFSKAQFGRKSGGPPHLEWLHDLDEVRGEFPGLEITAEEKEVVLDESVGHRGAAMVIEMVGKKPE